MIHLGIDIGIVRVIHLGIGIMGVIYLGIGIGIV